MDGTADRWDRADTFISNKSKRLFLAGRKKTGAEISAWESTLIANDSAHDPAIVWK